MNDNELFIKSRLGYVSREKQVESSGCNIILKKESNILINGFLQFRFSENYLQLDISDNKKLIKKEVLNAYKALRMLQDDLNQQSMQIITCGNCSNFRFSSMSYDMSDATKGYCAIGKTDSPSSLCNQNDVVAIWDVCENFSYGPEDVWED